jgi:hypothetical protein
MEIDPESAAAFNDPDHFEIIVPVGLPEGLGFMFAHPFDGPDLKWKLSPEGLHWHTGKVWAVFHYSKVWILVF